LDELVRAIKKDQFKEFKKTLENDSILAHSLIDNFNYPIHVACEFNRFLMVKHLVADGVDVNIRCKLTGYTPLMYAC
jgi:ankyrin repeat protein